MGFKARVAICCVTVCFMVMSLLSSLATVRSVRKSVEQNGVNSQIPQSISDTTSNSTSRDSILDIVQSVKKSVAKLLSKPESSASSAENTSITWVFFGLLALQAGCQPVLVQAFTPKSIVRSTAVMAQEIVKFIISFTCLAWSHKWKISTQGWTIESAVMAAGLPAGMFVIQNYCNLMANQTLPPVTFNVLNQTKTLSAALCCFLLLGKPQSGMQIVALILLVAAALVIQSVLPIDSCFPSNISTTIDSIKTSNREIIEGIPMMAKRKSKVSRRVLAASSEHSVRSTGSFDSSISVSDAEEGNRSGDDDSYTAENDVKSDIRWSSPVKNRDRVDIDDQFTKGVLPALFASFLSGLAGTLTQKTLQTQVRSPHLFNMELACFSTFFLLASLAMGSPDGQKLREGGISQGWTWKTWIPIFTNAAGGILVGFVTKYSGVVMKGFALIFGLLISGVLQHLTAPTNGSGGVTPEQIAGGCLGAVSLWMHASFPP